MKQFTGTAAKTHLHEHFEDISDHEHHNSEDTNSLSHHDSKFGYHLKKDKSKKIMKALSRSGYFDNAEMLFDHNE